VKAPTSLGGKGALCAEIAEHSCSPRTSGQKRNHLLPQLLLCNMRVSDAYSDVLGEEWDVSIFPNYTEWLLPNGIDPLAPGDEGLFGLFSDANDTQYGDATANTTAGEPFTPTQVEGPDILDVYDPLTVCYVNGLWGTISTEPETDPNDPNDLHFQHGTAVVLTAHPIDGKDFKHWVIYDPNVPDDANYAAHDSNLVTTILMDGPRRVDAVFKCGSGVGLILPIVMMMLAGLCSIKRKR